MKKALLLFSLALVVFASCKKDDDSEDSTSEPKYEFKNQVLQGQIEGEPWVFASGKFKLDTFFVSEGEYKVELYPITDSNMCDYFFNADTDRVILTVPLVIGINELNIDLSGNTDSETITLLDNETFTNVISHIGAYEVVRIDTAAGEMELKIDAQYDDQNFINGNCTISYCR
ncbi:MAG: hypothetical protein ACPGEG_10450 [Salibacteraceae bacterium]